jgi:hypothetical protein
LQPFTFDYYRHVLQRVAELGYRVSSFERYQASAPRTVIMRHDVDYTLNGVLQLAEIERSLGVTATYLFRVHAHEYNLFSPHAFMLVRRLLESGHEIGLHTEAMNVGRAWGVDPGGLLAKEKILLELIIDRPVRTTSEHRDISHTVHGTRYLHEVLDPHSAGFVNFAMAPAFFRDMKYLSDSNGVWREGDLLAHIGKHPRFQVLIHPDWWFERDLLLKGPYFHGLGN